MLTKQNTVSTAIHDTTSKINCGRSGYKRYCIVECLLNRVPRIKDIGEKHRSSISFCRVGYCTMEGKRLYYRTIIQAASLGSPETQIAHDKNNLLFHHILHPPTMSCELKIHAAGDGNGEVVKNHANHICSVPLDECI